MYRQTSPTGAPPTKRVIYIDFSVFDQINRGNQGAATAMRNLHSSGADLRISSWTYREMIQQPAIPRTVAINRLMIQDLGITVDPAIPFPQRVQLAAPNQLSRGGTILSPEDAQVVVGAKAGGGELWTMDRAVQRQPANIANKFGVTIAPETSTPVVTGQNPADYRVGRRLLGLPEVEISLSGAVRPVTGPGGGSGPSGGGGAAAPARGTTATPQAGERGQAPARPASPALVLERTRLLSELEQKTLSSRAFTSRVQTYVRIGGLLLTALEMFNAGTDVLSIASSGTTMPDAQNKANEVEAQSREALNNAEQTAASFSITKAIDQVENAISRGDQTVLFQLSSSLGALGVELSEQAYHYDKLSHDLAARAKILRLLSNHYAELAQVPQGLSTAPQASALATSISLDQLAGAMSNAAAHYDAAQTSTKYTSDWLLALAHRANSTAWINILRQIAELQRRRQQQASPPPAQPGTPAPPANAQ